MSGGGSKGAYEAGAFEGLVTLLPSNEVEYDIVTGVSVGSQNAGAIALFPTGDEIAANDFLQYFYNTIEAKDVYEIKWPVLYNFFFGNSVLSDAPLRKTLQKHLKNYGLHRKIILGATNLNTGEYTIFNDTALSEDDTLNAIIASSSIPMVFPPLQWNNVTWSDGGIVKNIDISSAVRYCLDEGYDQEDIIIDATFCHGGSFLSDDTDFDHVWDVYERMHEIQKRQYYFRYIEKVMKEYPKVNFRYFIRPSRYLKGNSMTFDHETISDRMALGK